MVPGRRSAYLLLVAFLLSLQVMAGEPYSKPELRADLLQMMEADQEARNEGDSEKVKELDREHS